MGKFSELDTVIKDLRTAASAINEAADTLAEMFSSPAEDEKPVLTINDLRLVFTAIASESMEQKKRLQALVRKYGADKLSDVNPKHYEAILKEAEVIRDAE